MRSPQVSSRKHIDRTRHRSALCLGQTRTDSNRDQLQTLRSRSDQLAVAKHHAHQSLKSEEHANLTLEHQQIMLKKNQDKLFNRVHHLTGRLTLLVEENQNREESISEFNTRRQEQQHRIIALNVASKKIIELNDSLEKILRQHHFIRTDEQEKLRSMKQISFQKRRALIVHTKRLRSLSLREHFVVDETIRTSNELMRTDQIRHQSYQVEKVSTMRSEFRRDV